MTKKKQADVDDDVDTARNEFIAATGRLAKAMLARVVQDACDGAPTETDRQELSGLVNIIHDCKQQK